MALHLNVFVQRPPGPFRLCILKGRVSFSVSFSALNQNNQAEPEREDKCLWQSAAVSADCPKGLNKKTQEV